MFRASSPYLVQVHHFLDSHGPLPFDSDAETVRLTTQHQVGHLVEPGALVGVGVHAERGSGSVSEDTLAPDTSLNDAAHRDTARGARHRAHVNLSAGDDHDDHDDHDDDALNAPTLRERRQALLAIDRFERHELRKRLRGERELERVRRRTLTTRASRPHARRSGELDARVECTPHGVAHLCDPASDRAGADRRRGEDHVPVVPARDPAQLVATQRPAIASRSVPLHGVALALYVVLVPYVVATKWRVSAHQSHAVLLRVLLVALTLFWIGFLVQVTRNIVRLRQGKDVHANASAWLAGLLLTALSLVLAPVTSSSANHGVHAVVTTTSTSHHRAHHGTFALGQMSGLSLALASKRRYDELRQGADDDELTVEGSIALLREANPEHLARLASLLGDRRDGFVASDLDLTLLPCATTITPTAIFVAPEGLYFAREGGQLTPPTRGAPQELVHRLVSLHDGPLRVVHDPDTLLRALATRSARQCLVVYTGELSTIDDELAACCVTFASREHPDTPAAVRAVNTGCESDVVVELLRAEPTVTGLHEPYLATLRRRCVEMTAYLALHRHEPVTGERLRTRVLVHADVDATQRTLANTASAVRRSLGSDDLGPRLHPVTSSGLYVTHGLSSDVERFTALVARARQLDIRDGAALAQRALVLIKGEVLASALRGFEWFLAEGHSARLARDAEWAALLVHHESLERGNFELAFWALQQGLLADPYSDALRDALARVPRLREFGGDRTGRTQDEPVGAERAVSMSWSFTGLSKQIFQ